MRRRRKCSPGLGIARFAGKPHDLITLAAQPLDICEIARRAGNAPALGGQALRQCLRRITKTEAEQAAHAPILAHSSATAGSASAGASNSRTAAAQSGASRDSAHTAMARTSGEASLRRSSTCGTSVSSPELPAAISTLRKKRSRPVRLIGVPRKRLRNAGSSSLSSSARGGLSLSARAPQLRFAATLANLFQGQTARQSSQPKMRLPIASRILGRDRALCARW